jgi:hypothetical protein
MSLLLRRHLRTTSRLFPLWAGFAAAASLGGGCSSSRSCEETLTCPYDGGEGGTDAGSSGSAGSAGFGKGGASGGKGGDAGRGGDAGSSGKAGTAGSGGTAGDAGASTAGSAGEEEVGGSAGAGGAGEPPQVIGVTPSDGSTDAEPRGAIEIEFSEELESATVSSETVKLTDGDDEVAGSITYAGRTVTFTPAVRLDLLGTYTIEVGVAVTDVDGLPMEAAFSASFSVRDGVWRDARKLGDSAQATPTGVASDGLGNVLVSWSEGQDAHARWSSPSDGPSSEQPSTTCTDCSESTVAANSSGEALFLYRLGTEDIRAQQLRGGTWQPAESVADVERCSDYIGLAMSEATEAHVLCVGQDHTEWTPVRTNDAHDWVPSDDTWSQIDYNAAIYDAAALSFNAAGNGIAVWPRGNVTTLAYSRYNRALGEWGAPADIPSSAGLTLAVALDSQGRAVASWNDYGNSAELQARLFTAAEGWSEPRTLNDDQDRPRPVVITADDEDFVAAWAGAPADTTNVYTNRFVDGTWQGPELRSDGISAALGSLALESDGRGNLLLVWASAGDRVAYSRYVKTTDTWTEPELLPETATTVGAKYWLTVADNGVAAIGFATSGTTPGGWVKFFE